MYASVSGYLISCSPAPTAQAVLHVPTRRDAFTQITVDLEECSDVTGVQPGDWVSFDGVPDKKNPTRIYARGVKTHPNINWLRRPDLLVRLRAAILRYTILLPLNLLKVFVTPITKDDR